MKCSISRRTFLNGCTLLMASAAIGSLTACSAGQENDTGLAQIVVGSDTYPPYTYLSNDGVPTGIDVKIATEAFRRMGYAARFETIDWEQKTNLVESGAIDCIWGCFSMEGRQDLYRWAGPYMVSRQVVAVGAGSSIQTLGDLAGKTIMVQSTTKPEGPMRASQKTSRCLALTTAMCNMPCWPADTLMPSPATKPRSCNI